MGRVDGDDGHPSNLWLQMRVCKIVSMNNQPVSAHMHIHTEPCLDGTRESGCKKLMKSNPEGKSP